MGRTLQTVRRRFCWVLTVLFTSIIFFASVPAHALINNGENAIDGLGQFDIDNATVLYTKGGVNNGPNQLGFNGPSAGMALDSVHHRFFVTDSGNNRVLVYTLDSGNNWSGGRVPAYVIGPPNFTSSTGGGTQSKLSNPSALAYDSGNDRLFVSDANNARVLVFSTSTITNGMNASYVLGQANFTSNGIAITQNGLRTPGALAYDSVNNLLYVADGGVSTSNNRVMVFNVAPGSISNGENASYVLGQSGFTSNTAATTQSGMSNYFVNGLAYDSANTLLYVSDYSNNRVLAFNVSSISNGMNASYVLGQSSFTSSGYAATQSGLYGPEGLAYDSVTGLLYVTDRDNNRVLVFQGANDITATGAPFYLSASQSFVSRASTATYFNSSGVLSTAAANTARTNYTYNGSSWVNAGTLIEPAATNVEPNSNTFAITQNATITTNAATSPDGTADANLFTRTSTSSAYGGTYVGKAASALAYTYSVYAQAGTGSYLALRCQGSYPARADVIFKLSTGTISTAAYATSTFTNASATITSVAGGWYLVTLTATTDAYGGITCNYSFNSNGVQLDGTDSSSSSSGYLFGQKLEQSSYATSYIPTSGSTVTRSADVYSANITGENASYVLGQSGFTTSTAATTQAGINGARGVAYDSGNTRLYVSELSNNRVTMFNTATQVTATGTPFYLGAGQAFVSRASTATYFDNTGTLQTAAVNVARDNHNFTSPYADLGTLIEAAATNEVSNSTMVGAATGTPGTLPTGWGWSQMPSGVTSSVVATGTDTNGLPYIDINLSGTPTVSNLPLLALVNYNGVSNGQTWTSSVYIKLISGSTVANALQPTIYNSAQTVQEQFCTSGALTPTSSYQQLSVACALTNSSDARFLFWLRWATTNGVAINETIRIAAPQLEQSTIATSFIPTSGTAVTRSADVYSSIVNGENASDGLGQFDIDNATVLYTKSGANNGPNQLGYASPESVAIDPLNHYLFVADYYDNRVLVYDLNTDNSFSSRTPANVLGQAKFTTSNSALSQSGMHAPTALATDPVNSRLFVADQSSSRVLVFNTATITNGMNASYVLGQSGFTTGTAATTQAGLSSPTGLAYDSADGLLYVADTNNNRVMVFNVAPGSIASGENASYELGQPSGGTAFTTATAATTQSGLSTPNALAYDPVNARLFVADIANERVMVFNVAPASISNGENASYELGQPGGANAFTTSGAATTQSGFNNLWGVAYDPTNSRLFTVEGLYANRVKVFNVAPASIANGENASNVVGQANFTSGSTATTQSGLYVPRNVMYDPASGRLFVGDWGNNRVMVFEATFAPPYDYFNP